ncbi:LysR substrate-binding domain-containing protein [Mesorhizobium sp. BHbsci]
MVGWRVDGRYNHLAEGGGSVSLQINAAELLERIGPHFDQIEVEVDALNELREKPAGTIRLSAPDYAISSILWPKLKRFLPKYPDIKVELLLDNGLTDIVTERYDAGVRMGEQLAKDMISRSHRAGFPVRGRRRQVLLCRASRAGDAAGSRAARLHQLPFSNVRALYVSEFEENGREIKIRVDGQLVFNNIFHVLDAALAGRGLGYVPEEIALPHIAKGRLARILEGWSPYWDGYHLYYPSRRQSSFSFVALVDALRHRE